MLGDPRPVDSSEPCGGLWCRPITRRRTLDAATDSTGPVWEAARGLFDEWAREQFQPVRLIGVTASDLTRGQYQMDLFANPVNEKHRRLDQTLDRINEKFGKAAIHRGGGRKE